MAFMSATAVRNTKIISLIGTGHGMSHFYGLALAPLIPLIIADFNVSYAAVGFLFTILNITSTVFQVPVGFLVDRIGGRILLPLGLGMMAVPFLAFGFADSYWFALALMAIAGIGSSVFHPVDYAILNATIDESFLGRAFSLHTFTGSIGVLIAPATMALLASIWDWRTALIIAGGFGLFFMVLMIANGHLLHGNKTQSGGQEEKTDASPPFTTMDGIRTIFLPQVLLMALFYIVITIITNGLMTFTFAIFVDFYQFPKFEATSLVTAFIAAGSVGLLVGGVIADKWQRHMLLTVIALFTVAGLLIVVGAAPLPFLALLAAFIMMGFMSATIRPARDLIVRSIIPKNAMGKVYGFLSAAMSAGHAIAPLLIGWLIDREKSRIDGGSGDIVFYVLAGIMLLGIPTIIFAQNSAATNSTKPDTETAAGKSAAE